MLIRRVNAQSLYKDGSKVIILIFIEMQKKMKINKIPAINKLLTEFVKSTVFQIKKKTDSIKKKANERVLE